MLPCEILWLLVWGFIVLHPTIVLYQCLVHLFLCWTLIIVCMHSHTIMLPSTLPLVAVEMKDSALSFLCVCCARTNSSCSASNCVVSAGSVPPPAYLRTCNKWQKVRTSSHGYRFEFGFRSAPLSSTDTTDWFLDCGLSGVTSNFVGDVRPVS